ncbi:MAG TPA: hypothetical protein VJZ26_09250 [Blastocatellia bacterium]|nr:hypothetical protein [Blastocatellia bacterium]
MFKKITVIAVLFVFAFLAAAPDTFAGCHRNRRASYRTAYYSPYRYQSAYYSPYRYRGVAGQRYYAYNRYNRYNGYSGYRRGHSTRNLILSIAAPGAIGAGVGALFGGKRGAGVGALLGGGGGAAYYLLKHRNRRY